MYANVPNPRFLLYLFRLKAHGVAAEQAGAGCYLLGHISLPAGPHANSSGAGRQFVLQSICADPFVPDLLR